MKGKNIRHSLGIKKAPNKRRPKNRDVYLFDKSAILAELALRKNSTT